MIGALDMGSWANDDDVELDSVDVDLSDLDAPPARADEWDRALAAVRRRCEAKFRGKIAELEATIVELRSPPPESSAAESIEALLARPMDGAEFAAWCSSQKFPLRQWLEGATPTAPQPQPVRAPAQATAPTLPPRYGSWSARKTR